MLGILIFGVICMMGVVFLVRFLIAICDYPRSKQSRCVIHVAQPTKPRTNVQQITDCAQSRRRSAPFMPAGDADRNKTVVRKSATRLAVAALIFIQVLFRPASACAQSDAAQENRELRELVLQLQERVEQLEQRSGQSSAATNTIDASATGAGAVQQTSSAQAANVTAVSSDDRAVLNYLKGTTINLTLDGYYAYNFNRPVGRINLLRAYDVSSNSFSLNQATLVFERAPDVAAGRRFGARVDLQFGQATDTLQGNAANEPRPQVYRPLFQAYGTYVAPLGSGLTVDFGKWACAQGFENNFSKDQIN